MRTLTFIVFLAFLELFLFGCVKEEESRPQRTASKSITCNPDLQIGDTVSPLLAPEFKGQIYSFKGLGRNGRCVYVVGYLSTKDQKGGEFEYYDFELKKIEVQ